MKYPPGTRRRDYRRIPPDIRPDAVQAAWVAFLLGKDPILGAVAYYMREYRYKGRHLPLEDWLPEEDEEDEESYD